MPQVPLADSHEPATLHWMPADGATTAIVVCPGGGYRFCSDREAENVGRWLNGLGISAAVLRYRVAPHRQPAALEDALEAMRQTRRQPGVEKLGLLGFSAGGHLAAHVAAVGQDDARPDVALLAYAVVSLLPQYMHGGSRDNLLGPDATDDDARELSIEHLAHDQMPPTFIWHTAEDKVVPPQNAYLLATRLADLGVSHEVHVYERGAHGLSLLDDDPSAPREVATWTGHAADFLRRHGFGSA